MSNTLKYKRDRPQTDRPEFGKLLQFSDKTPTLTL